MDQPQMKYVRYVVSTPFLETFDYSVTNLLLLCHQSRGLRTQDLSNHPWNNVLW